MYVYIYEICSSADAKRCFNRTEQKSLFDKAYTAHGNNTMIAWEGGKYI